jgi:AhpD family alkylhydroperoxidase
MRTQEQLRGQHRTWKDTITVKPRKTARQIWPIQNLRLQEAPARYKKFPHHVPAFDSQFEEIVMMIDWNEYHRQFGARVGELMKLSPDTVKGYQTLSAANSATTKLGEKMRQLISLAVAITTKCDGCIVHHTDAALKAGATKEEIAEALGVAVGMNAGAALVYSTRVLDAVEAKSAAVR